MSARPRTRSGFTLVEIMVAMAIMGIFMMSSVGFMRWVIRATDLSGRMTVANALTQSKLDALVAAGSTTAGSGTWGSYNQTWTITSTGAVRYLSVTTSYLGVENATHAITLQEIYAP
jgi:prepilin-type N-terminal cleavage/methylation domain-containing protein